MPPQLGDGEDELAVADLPVDTAANALLQRCLLTGHPEKDAERIQHSMQQAAPVLYTEIKAMCPECGMEHQLAFDIQSFLLSKLIADQPSVLRDIHRLAYTYHWSHREILDLPRRLRRAYVNMIEAEKSS